MPKNWAYTLVQPKIEPSKTYVGLKASFTKVSNTLLKDALVGIINTVQAIIWPIY